MSVFGGDSWGREAQSRKRRVDDLIIEDLDTSSFKKLSNGKYACIVCSNNPVFDSSLTLSMHTKGSRHVMSLSELKEKELMKQEDMNKRIALSDGSSKQQIRLKSKPLIEWTKKITTTTQTLQTPQMSHGNTRNGNYNVKCDKGSTSISSSVPKQGTDDSEMNNGWEMEVARKMLVDHQLEVKKRREKEIKFISAGWKRDCHGKWFKDENVEFDSDEEDPNVCLRQSL